MRYAPAAAYEKGPGDRGRGAGGEERRTERVEERWLQAATTGSTSSNATVAAARRGHGTHSESQQCLYILTFLLST